MLVSTKLFQMYEIDNGPGVFPMSDNFFSLNRLLHCLHFVLLYFGYFIHLNLLLTSFFLMPIDYSVYECIIAYLANP